VSLRPAEDAVPLGQLHDWVFHLETRDGETFTPTLLTVEGGMPQHDHGFASEPRITRALGEGDFLLEGVKFHMAGSWTFRFRIAGPAGGDVATFEVPVGPALAASWSTGERELLRSLWIGSLPPLEPSATNPVADDPRATRLGHRLFFETALSRTGSISCASCHQPERDFSDGLPHSLGLGETSRNSPTLLGAAYSPWLFWDGRRDSLWSQALAPLEAAVEMGSTRLEVVRFVTADPSYRDAYVELFGPPPDFADRSRFPDKASPFGDAEAKAAWQRLEGQARSDVNHAFANVGRAIAAYERLLVPGPGRFDRYVEQLEGELAADADGLLSDDELAGLRLFIDAGRTQCLRCHNGPLLTNQNFHDIGTSRLGPLPDFGRFLGAQSLLLDEFNCLGPYSGAPPDACEELRFLNRREIGATAGAFRTPTLRSLTRTAPYLHDGSFASLGQVMEHYRRPPTDTDHELTPLEIDSDEVRQLVAFLTTLSGEPATAPRWLTPPPAK